MNSYEKKYNALKILHALFFFAFTGYWYLSFTTEKSATFPIVFPIAISTLIAIVSTTKTLGRFKKYKVSTKTLLFLKNKVPPSFNKRLKLALGRSACDRSLFISIMENLVGDSCVFLYKRGILKSSFIKFYLVKLTALFIAFAFFVFVYLSIPVLHHIIGRNSIILLDSMLLLLLILLDTMPTSGIKKDILDPDKYLFKILGSNLIFQMLCSWFQTYAIGILLQLFILAYSYAHLFSYSYNDIIIDMAASDGSGLVKMRLTNFINNIRWKLKKKDPQLELKMIERDISRMYKPSNNPYYHIVVPMNTTPLEPRFYTLWVASSYITLFSERAIFNSAFLYDRLDREAVKKLLGIQDWRPRTVAVMYILLKRYDDFVEHLAKLFLRCDIASVGYEYSLALAYFAGDIPEYYVKKYLDHYLQVPNDFYRQHDAMNALYIIDKKNQSNCFSQYLPMYEEFCKSTGTQPLEIDFETNGFSDTISMIDHFRDNVEERAGINRDKQYQHK